MDSKLSSRGFTLIASLMLLMILSGIAIGLMMMVSTENKVGTHDVQNNLTFHAAEGAIEHMTSDLAALFQTVQAPTVAAIEGLSSLAPANNAFMSYPVYSLTPATTAGGALATSFGQIQTGPYQGLYAQILPITLQATAQGPLGDEVNMSRTVEMALVPVFQFGIFSQSDLSFFAGPSLDFNGRVHTNGDLYLSEGSGGVLTFHDKLTAWGNVIRWQQPNGNLNTTAPAHMGSVFVPTTTAGCDGAKPACVDMGPDTGNAANDGSITLGAAQGTWTTAGQNTGPPTWQTISAGSWGGMIIDGDYGTTAGVPAGGGGTGASLLNLPFVNGTGATAASPQPYEIIRRPPPGESPTSLLGSARLYNEASIRVLLSDTPADLPGGIGDPQNIRLANVGANINGVYPTSTPAGACVVGAGQQCSMYFAEGTTAVPDSALWSGAVGTIQTDWPYVPQPPIAGFVTLFDPNAPVMSANPPGDGHGLTAATQPITLSTCNVATGSCAAAAPYPYYTPLAYNAANTLPVGNTNWNMLDGYIRVEYLPAGGGAYVPITSEWLQLGFARDVVPPIAPGGNPGGNDINPNAILLFQRPADRNENGVIDALGTAPSCVKVGGVWNCTSGKPPEVTKDPTTGSPWYGSSTAPVGQGPSMYNWYPINFYDAREGEVRDVNQGASCAPAGIMNAVELDVGNLNRWLHGLTGVSGPLVNNVNQNGYVLYFSDRRGMLPNPNGTFVDAAGTKTGDAGLEDSINQTTAVGTPDGTLTPIPPGKAESPEDVNNNLALDNWGGSNLGLGLGSVPPFTYGAGSNVNRRVMANPAIPNAYLTVAPGRIPVCTTVAHNNWVSGARHVLRLVDGSLGNVPSIPGDIVVAPNTPGGFTVGSENPVYVWGNYNSNCTAAGGAGCTPGNLNYDTAWNVGGAEPTHAASGIIADAVTVLSNNWSDIASLNSPSSDGGRPAGTAYYRVAVASGKNINFPVTGCCAAWAIGDWGTDGGLHNFLRQLENWGGQTLNYKGSMVSMYYATYATGTDKNGGGAVYDPAARNYVFDPLFVNPQDLPPGTPLFRDIDNLSYRQTLTACTALTANGVCAN